MKNIVSLNHNIYAVYAGEKELLGDKLDYVANKIVAIEIPGDLRDCENLGYIELDRDGFGFVSSENILTFEKNGFVGIYAEEELGDEEFIADLEVCRHKLLNTEDANA